VPKQRRPLAALGPRVLKLAAERSAGAYPFLVAPAYTDAATAAKQLHTQLDAGASQLVVRGCPARTRWPILIALAPELGMAAQ
jgi:hypothetical protein